jgi:spermidine synthase
LYFGDGIRWMAEAKPNTCDVIIIDSTDPVGPAEGLFTRTFYENCWRALSPGGILVQQSESPLYHMELIKSMHDAMQAAGFSHTHTLPFPQPCYPSGWWSATMAGKGVAVKQFRQQDAEHKAFTTLYYNAGIHQGALAQPEFMQAILK